MFIDNRKKAYLERNIGDILNLLISEDKLLPHSKEFISILQNLKKLDSKKNIFSPDDVIYLNNLDSKFKSILENKDSKIRVDIHTNPVEGRVMYESLEEPFVRNIKGFRGAFYHHKEYKDAR